jgi:hypothetical protein
MVNSGARALPGRSLGAPGQYQEGGWPRGSPRGLPLDVVPGLKRSRFHLAGGLAPPARVNRLGSLAPSGRFPRLGA